MSRDPVFLCDIHSSGRSTAQVNGKQVFLDGGIPGETVTYTLKRRKPGYRAGQVEQVIQASPARVKPFCRHYESCGGCPWQHMDYSQQLDLKRKILIQALDKYGITVPEIPSVIPSGQLTGYRHRMEYAFSATAGYGGDIPAGPGLGFHRSGISGAVTGITECSLQSGTSREICEFVEKLARREHIGFYNSRTQSGLLRSLSLRVNREGSVMVTFGFSEEPAPEELRLLSTIGVAFPEISSLCYTIHPSPAHSQMQGTISPMPGYPDKITETLDGLRFCIHASSFFQPNVTQAESVFSSIREWANLQRTERVYDLYAGVGTISLYLAPRAARVIGIEGSAQAIKDAEENALENSIRNVTFLTGDILGTFRPSFLETHGKPDLIVLDPPRSGTLIEIKKTIINSGAEKVIYLSCNPVSLAFDLKQLSEAFHVTRIQPFDMLPQTQHLETLVMMEKK